MKLVIAYIQPEKLDDVKRSLFDHGITKMSVTNSLGCGQQMGYQETYRGVRMEVNLLKKTRLEIAVSDGYLEPTIEAPARRARRGLVMSGEGPSSHSSVGGGKRFVARCVEAPHWHFPAKVVGLHIGQAMLVSESCRQGGN